MSKVDISKILKSTKKVLNQRSPEILTGIGIAGMVITTVLAVKATPKAMRAIQKEEKKLDQGEKLSAKDVVKVSWKYYVPATITSACSIACLIGASSVNLKRNAALATAYKLSETALTEYKEKVIETIGEKKERKIREDISKDHFEKDQVSTKEIFITNTGKTRFYDVMAKRKFTSDIQHLKKIENELNRRMRDEMYITLNDFYHEIGLEPIPVGDILCWNIDKGYIDMQFDSFIDDEDVPCIVVDFLVRPTYDYEDRY